MEPVLPFDLDLQGIAGKRMVALHGALRAAILDGRLPAGFALPATRRLAAHLGLARNTVASAYDRLTAEGYVVPRVRARSVVADLRRRTSPLRKTSTSVADPRLAGFWRTRYLPSQSAPDIPARSFRLGAPEHRWFPHAVWRRLTTRTLRANEKAAFLYPPSNGLPQLRTAIAQHVAFTRAVACTADDVMVTSGAQQAFDLLARLLVTPGKTSVAVENPGYPPLRAAFAAAGARLVPIPVDDEGLRVEDVPIDTRVICVTPSHQFPTGSMLSLRRRTALLEFARQRGAVIIEDDYDGEFRFGARPLDALQTLDRHDLVFYVGTFSKTLFPALRKGFVVAPHWARTALLSVKEYADSHCDAITQSALAEFIRAGHMSRYVRRMQRIYAQRRDAMLFGLADLQEWLAPIPSEAGLHIAARLRNPARAKRFFALLHEYAPGAQSAAEDAFAPLRQPVAVFGYGVIDIDEIGARLRALRAALARSR